MAAVATASCAKEIAQTNAPEENLNLSPLTLSACTGEEDTKAGFSETAYPVIEWKANDAISILGTATGNQKFTTDAAGASVEFSGLANIEDKTLYAVYPYDANITLNTDGTLAGVRIPEIQTATAGSFDPKAYVAVAECTDKNTLSFKNLGAFLKFQVADAANVESVTFIGNNSENLACTADKVNVTTVSHSGPKNSNVYVRVQGTFEEGKDYFAIIRPNSFANGITVCVKYTDNTIKYCMSASQVFNNGNRNRIKNLGILNPTKDISEDLYACYVMGKNIDIAGTKVNRNSYPGGTLITEDSKINNGVFFIGEGITATLENAGKTIVIGRYAGKTSTVARNDSYIRVTATAEDDYILMKNITLNINHGGTQKYMMSMSADETFEQIMFDGCKILFPTGKTILLSASKGKAINNIAFNGCDIKLSDAESNIINYASNQTAGTENTSTVESLVFNNNIVYSASDIAKFKIFSAKWAPINTLSVTKNTFYNTYCDGEGYIITNKCTNFELKYNVFSMPNYASYANNSWWGFLKCNGTGNTTNDKLTYYPEEGKAAASNNLSYQKGGNTFKVSFTDMKNSTTNTYYSGVSNPAKTDVSPFETEDTDTPIFVLTAGNATKYVGAQRTLTGTQSLSERQTWNGVSAWN